MKFASCLLVAATICLSGALSAREQSKDQREQSRRVLSEFAGCIVQYEPELARTYVLTDDRLPDDQWTRLVDKRCLKLNRGNLKMNSFYFRGALAQRMLANRMVPSTTAFAGVAPVVYNDDAGDPAATMNLYSMKLGECVVRGAPDRALSLFATKPDSDAEKDAFAALGGDISACVPLGSQVRIGKESLRAGMATIYARMAAKAGAVS